MEHNSKRIKIASELSTVLTDSETVDEVKRLRIENIYLKQMLQGESSYKECFPSPPVVQPKRNSLSARGSKKKVYDPVDIQLALDTERNFFEGKKLIVHFPDASFDDQAVMKCDKNIESVTFITQKHPRYCTIVVDPNVNIEELIKKINKTPFDNGFLSAKQVAPSTVNDKRPINPCMLYVGNIPMNPKISSQVIKSLFVKSKKIDISTNKKSPFKFLHAQYQTVQDAIYDFKRLVQITICNQSLDVHFFRLNEKALKNNYDNEEHDSETSTVDSSTRQNAISHTSSQERENSVFNQAIRSGLIQINSSGESVHPDSSVKQEKRPVNVKTEALCDQSNIVDSQSSENNCYGSIDDDGYGDSAVTSGGGAGDDDDEDDEEDDGSNDFGLGSNNIMFLPFHSADDDDDDSDYST